MRARADLSGATVVERNRARAARALILAQEAASKGNALYAKILERRAARLLALADKADRAGLEPRDRRARAAEKLALSREAGLADLRALVMSRLARVHAAERRAGPRPSGAAPPKLRWHPVPLPHSVVVAALSSMRAREAPEPEPPPQQHQPLECDEHDARVLFGSMSALDTTIEHVVPGEPGDLPERLIYRRGPRPRLSDEARARRSLYLAESHQRERALLLWS